VYRDLLGKPEGKRPLGRRMRRWEYNIKEDLKEVGWGIELDFSGSSYGQVVGSCIKDNERSGSIKDIEFLDYLRIDYLGKKDFAPLN
jgi:hypothetical protein